MGIVPALIVKQWLEEWNETQFNPVPPRAKPAPQFYMFSISALQLKRLTGIYRRDPNAEPSEDMGIQRRHDPDRSREILRYIQNGFPLSRINPKKLVDPDEERTLRMPGWLPTAVIVNILAEDDRRGPKNTAVQSSDVVRISSTGDQMASIIVPEHCVGRNWKPRIHPIEVIDGQHRLWALEETEDSETLWTDEFRRRIEHIQVPVVAFHGLDAAWRAYLFYTINQLPKKIDTSMVFDLYPLLRTQDWLLRFEGPKIYRQTRAQDLTILLWAHPASPWKDRIVRLGGREKGKVTQASFIQSLMASFVKRYDAGRIGGFFGSSKGRHTLEMNWVREQQAAFLIFAWQTFRETVIKSRASWTKSILRTNSESEDLFEGDKTLIATDQGVRGFLCVLNDILWIAANNEGMLDLGWDWTRRAHQEDEQAVTDAIRSLKKSLPKTTKLVERMSKDLSDFDWRLSSAIEGNVGLQQTQAAYRGSGGYKLIRQNLLSHLKRKGRAPVSSLANEALTALDMDSGDDD